MESIAPPQCVHVCVPRDARPMSRRGVRVHWQRLDHHEVVGDATSPLRTVLDCAVTLPFEQALAIADSALRRDLVDPDELLDAAARCRGPGRTRRLRVVAAADGRADNPFESALRAILICHGVTGFEPQLRIRDDTWSVRVDLGDRERRIVLEADSFVHHGTREALVRDCCRYDELVIRGWLVLRFAWEHVMLDPGWVADVVLRAVALRDGRRTDLPNSTRRSPVRR
jgi:very-short-patch-repair endonuclease